MSHDAIVCLDVLFRECAFSIGFESGVVKLGFFGYSVFLICVLGLMFVFMMSLY